MIIRSLQAFLALQRRGTIASAADEVFLSPAAVSARLKMMEQELGVDLFVRTKRSLALTSAGHRLVPMAEQMLVLYDEMKALSDTNTLQGKMTLGVVNSALTGVLPDVLHRFKTAHTLLEIKIIAGNSVELFEQVDAGILDAAVVTQPPKQFVTNLLIHHLYTEPYALILPGDMVYSTLSSALSSAPYIAFERSTWAGRQIDEFLTRCGFQIRPEMELNSLEAVRAVVSRGLGLSIVPLVRGNRHQLDSSLRVIPIPGFNRNVSLVQRKQHPHTQLTAGLLSAFDILALDSDEEDGTCIADMQAHIT